MLRVGFEPTIPAFEGAKIVHALDRAATMMGLKPSYPKYLANKNKYISQSVPPTLCFAVHDL
jgi:hypothetical protein